MDFQPHFKLQSAMVSVVDDFPQKYLDLLTSRNIDVWIEIREGGKRFSE
jgi:hypothetical protein